MLNVGIFASFLTPGLIRDGSPGPGVLLTYLATIVSFIVIPSVISNLIRKSRKNEFMARVRLDDEVRRRGEIIDAKVKEVLTASEQIRRKNAELEATKQLSELAARVAHDIRSPLTALGIVTADIEMIPQDRRRLVQTAVARINDIANSLLSYRKYRSAQKVSASQVVPLGALIDRMVSEKRLERTDQRNVRINYLETQDQFAAFVNVPVHDLERHFSNILNNAIEAVGDRGEVNVYILRSGRSVTVRVDDTGPGIPSDILERVATKGFSTKSNGHGLGLYHAKEFLNGVGGSLEIESKINLGTSIIMNLPMAEPPGWCLDKLSISKFSKIVVVDDDSPILEVWQKRFGAGVGELIYFADPNEFSTEALNNQNALYLVDYEFRNISVTGIDLIKQNNLGNSAVLVTSRFEDQDVIEKAQAIGVKILPKNWIPIVPFG